MCISLKSVNFCEICRFPVKQKFPLGLLTYIWQFYVFFSGFMPESTGNPWVSLKSANFNETHRFRPQNLQISVDSHLLGLSSSKVFNTKDHLIYSNLQFMRNQQFLIKGMVCVFCKQSGTEIVIRVISVFYTPVFKTAVT